jgi:SAM-dependent methyltransferase
MGSAMSAVPDVPIEALRGNPSMVWRAGQQRRLEMIRRVAGERLSGRVLDNGCGIGLYVEKLAAYGGRVVGVEFELDRARQALAGSALIGCAAGEALPFPAASFDFILSHEVLEHVADDRRAMEEMARVLRRGGRIALFVPNRGYPFETHGVFWRGRYRFGNIPLVNYLPSPLRDRLAPHVRAYRRRDLQRLVEGLPLRVVSARVIFGAYDNIIARYARLGRALRWLLHTLEGTPLQAFGLSHFWVLERL